MTQKTLNIVITIISILCLGLAAVFAAFPGKAQDNQSSSDVTYLLSEKNPISKYSNNPGGVSLELVDTESGSYTVITTTETTGGGYATASLKKQDLRLYETYIIEFDIFTPKGAGALNANINFTTIRDGDSASTNSSNSASSIKLTYASGDKFTLTTGTTTTNPKNEFHVEYRINVNKYDMSKSTLSIYIDGVKTYDSTEYETPVFASNVRYLHAVKFTKPYIYKTSEDASGSVVIGNLKMKGITR